MDGPPVAGVTVVGVGADGWAGLTDAARAAITDADVVVGSDRQLALLPDAVSAVRHPWPSPMLPAVATLLDDHPAGRLVVLASGDPMFFGVGGTLARVLGADRLRVIPHPSSVSLACARLGWAAEDVDVVSLVGRPIETVHPAIQPGRRVLVLVSDPSAGTELSKLLVTRGYGHTSVTALQRLGAADQTARSAAAHDWTGDVDRLTVLALDCRADLGAPALPRTPGLPDDAFVTDGQLTKRELRALAMSALAPAPGQLLWDVGAGSGSIGVEWMRTHPSCKAVAVERREDRCVLIEMNAEALGVPGLSIVHGSAPEALRALPTPDAIFVGGAVSVPGVLDACVHALPEGGRLVAHAVTLESEAALASWHGALGGALTRVSIERAEPIGAFTGWRPARPVTQWAYTKETA
jgi:precorrin-6Y C5,15-methyltransferase (decarboxylating)